MNALRVSSAVQNLQIIGRIQKVIPPREITITKSNGQRTTHLYTFYINDGSGEAPVTIWENVKNYQKIVNMIELDSFYSISNFIVESLNVKYSQGHLYGIKLIAKTIIEKVSIIPNFHAFELVKDYVDLSVVLLHNHNTNIWVKGIITENGEIKHNLMNDNIRRELKICDESKESSLLLTVWGEINDKIVQGSLIEACGKVTEFSGFAVFSVTGSDINILEFIGDPLKSGNSKEEVDNQLSQSFNGQKLNESDIPLFAEKEHYTENLTNESNNKQHTDVLVELNGGNVDEANNGNVVELNGEGVDELNDDSNSKASNPIIQSLKVVNKRHSTDTLQNDDIKKRC